MPIIGLTDRTRPTLLGMIRIGEKKVAQNGKEYPSKLDYFEFDPYDDANREVILAKAFEIYGEKPKSIRVKFHSDNQDDIFDANYCLWQASGLLCKGNGKTAVRLDDKFVQMREERTPKTGTDPQDIIEDETIEGETFTRVVCHTPSACAYAMSRGAFGKPGCSAKGFLRVILPDMPGLGVWGLSTGSINSIAQLNSAVQYLYGAFGGRLFGREANLIITPKQGIIPETQKRTTIFVLNLTTEHSFNELAVLANQAPVTPMLTHDTDVVNPETGEVYDEQYHDGGGDDADFRPQLDDDPEVIRALSESGFSDTKKKAMLASAIEHGKTREDFIAAIRAQMPPQQQEIPVAAQPAAAAPRPAAAQQPAPAQAPAPARNGGRPNRLF